MEATFKSLDDENPSSTVLFKERWNFPDENFLSSVENAVYDHPQILDDFATEIMIVTDKSLWVPSALMEEEDAEEKYFNCVYDCEPEDIFADYFENETCLYSSTAGLQAFLNRTLPGCRIMSHISFLKKFFQERADGGNKIFLNVSENSVDVIAFKGREFQCASTHPWREASDLGYLSLLTTHAFDIDPKSSNLNVYAPDYVREDLKKLTGHLFADVRKIEIPGLEPNRPEGLAAALQLLK